MSRLDTEKQTIKMDQNSLLSPSESYKEAEVFFSTIYSNEINKVEEENGESYYLRVGRNLTLGLLKVIGSAISIEYFITYIIDYYEMDTEKLQQLIVEEDPSIKEFYELKILNVETLSKIQEKNMQWFTRIGLNG